jgi:hypothetical protein
MATDLKKFIGGLKIAGDAQIAAARQALDEFGEHVLGDAQQLAPVGGGLYSPNDPAPGTLKASGTTEPAVVSGNRIKKEIGFNTVYAAVQHERIEFNHDQGEAKYLENAIRANAPKMGPYLADRMRQLAP